MPHAVITRVRISLNMNDARPQEGSGVRGGGDATVDCLGIRTRLRADAVCTVLPAESPCLRVRFTPGRHTFISSPVFFAHASLYNEGSTGRVAAHFLPGFLRSGLGSH